MKEHVAKSGSPSVKRDFLIFISIPLLVILVVAAVLQGPNLFTKPKYDFIYAFCQSFECNGTYTVDSTGTVTLQQDNLSYGGDVQPALYYYDETNNATKQISLAEANSYRLDTSNVSPDGYTLWQDNGSGDLVSGVVWSDNSNYGTWYLKHGSRKKQLNLVTGNTYNDIQFLGWVQQ